MDGGWHFSRSEPYVPLGRSVAKWRCLEMRGWRVVSVPWFRWFELQVRFGGDDRGGRGGGLPGDAGLAGGQCPLVPLV